MMPIEIDTASPENFDTFFGDTSYENSLLPAESEDAGEYYTTPTFPEEYSFAEFTGPLAEYVEEDPEWVELAHAGVSYQDAVRQAFPGFALLEDAEIDSALATMLEDASDAEIFKFLRKLAPIGRRIARIGAKVVGAAAPIAGRIAGGIIGGPAGAQIGGMIGQAGGRLASRGLAHLGRRRRRRPQRAQKVRPIRRRAHSPRRLRARPARSGGQIVNLARRLLANPDILRMVQSQLSNRGNSEAIAYISGSPIMISETLALTEADIIETLESLQDQARVVEFAGEEDTETSEDSELYLQAAELLVDHIEAAEMQEEYAFGWSGDMDDYQ